LSEFVFTALAASIMSLTLLQWARQPEFAVDKEGVLLPFNQHRPHGSWRGPWDVGRFRWDEVSYCRWSRYEKGLLQVQVKATRSRNQLGLPPSRFSYRVAEPYREIVENAIRSAGKWSE
jgi:hypothetical protein